MPLQIKRIYDEAEPEDGYRVLIDRLWPRGVKKADAQIDVWQKELAPSHELRKWFGHEAAKWDEFKQRYYKELETHQKLLDDLSKHAAKDTVTLVFAAKAVEHSNAQALKELLETEE